MAIEVKQDFKAETLAYDGRKGKYSGTSRSYIVTGADDEASAIVAVNSTAPATYNGCRRTGTTITERFADGGYKVEVRYEHLISTLNSSDDNEPEKELSFDVSGVQTHITRAYSTRAKTSGAPDCDDLIGWDGSSVQGCDVIVPEQKFQEVHYFKDGRVTTALKKKWVFRVGRVNSDTFRGYEAGEVLLLGVSGRRSGTGRDDLWQVTFSFGVRENETLTVNGESLIKHGWDYVTYSWTKRISGNKISPKLKYAYVSKVYKSATFGELGIGN